MALALALFAYAASARYAVVVTPVATVSIGIMNGAATFQVRNDTVRDARTRPLGSGDQKRFSLYRHGYRWAWGVRGWGDFVDWARGRRAVTTAPAASAPAKKRVPGTTASVIPLLMSTPRASTVCLLEVPLWLPLGALAAPYLLLVVRRARRKRWQCVGCGYDLRSVAGAACPECGGSRAQVSKSGAATGAALDSPKSGESAPSTRPS